FNYLLTRYTSILGYISEYDRRSWHHRAWNRFFIGYCFLISIRFVVYSLALRYSLESILRWDRLFATISPNGVFVNQYASLCWSMEALCGAFHQYVFFLRPDSVMFELYAYFLGLK